MRQHQVYTTAGRITRRCGVKRTDYIVNMLTRLTQTMQASCLEPLSKTPSTTFVKESYSQETNPTDVSKSLRSRRRSVPTTWRQRQPSSLPLTTVLMTTITIQQYTADLPSFNVRNDTYGCTRAHAHGR